MEEAHWKVWRDCRLKDYGVHQVMFGIARLYYPTLTG
jgi:hypothetical protein